MWYSAKLLFEVDQNDNGRVLQEESIRLIDATTEQEALSKAKELGIASQHEYDNSEGQAVRWKFVDVLDVQDLCEAAVYDGIEVFSVMHWQPVSVADVASPHVRTRSDEQ